MPDELVCVATFDKVPEAHLCKSQLESAGIRSVLENEFTVSVNWLLNNAVGGIRLYVAAEHRDAALQVLAQGKRLFHLDEDEDSVDESWAGGSPDEVAAGPSATRAEDHGVSRKNSLAEDDEEAPWESDREAHAKRALMFAVTGMIIFPLQIFTVWILWEVATMGGSLRPLYRFYCTGAALIALPYLGMLVLLGLTIAYGLLT